MNKLLIFEIFFVNLIKLLILTHTSCILIFGNDTRLVKNTRGWTFIPTTDTYNFRSLHFGLYTPRTLIVDGRVVCPFVNSDDRSWGLKDGKEEGQDKGRETETEGGRQAG